MTAQKKCIVQDCGNKPTHAALMRHVPAAGLAYTETWYACDEHAIPANAPLNAGRLFPPDSPPILDSHRSPWEPIRG